MNLTQRQLLYLIYSYGLLAPPALDRMVERLNIASRDMYAYKPPNIKIYRSPSMTAVKICKKSVQYFSTFKQNINDKVELGQKMYHTIIEFQSLHLISDQMLQEIHRQTKDIRDLKKV